LINIINKNDLKNKSKKERRRNEEEEEEEEKQLEKQQFKAIESFITRYKKQ
jgi:hypothetical protein